MSLAIQVNDDRSITIVSDDANAENFAVGEALETAELAAADTWSDAPMVDGQLKVTFPEDEVEDVLEALENDFFMLVEKAMRQLESKS